MADTNRWSSMSSSQQFGIYRETAGKHGGTSRRKFYCTSVIFLIMALMVCLTILSITTGKGRRKISIMSDQNAGANRTVQLVGSKANTTVTSHINVTEETQTTVEPSMPRPEIASSSLRSPDEDELVPTTAVYEPDELGVIVSESSLEFASRKGRIMNEPPISPYNTRAPPRFPNSLPAQERPNIILFSSAPDFQNNFAQMGPYRHQGPKNQAELLDFAADDRPIPILSGAPTIKFTGVYVRGPAEEIENISLDKKTTHLNGHAYSAVDPFKAYKPSHPSEINHLATTSSDFDTGPRFSNKIVRATVPSLDIDSGASSGMMTQAIFRPYETPEGSSMGSFSTGQKPDKNGRPLKIMLDIYPMRPPDSAEHGSAPEPVRHRKPVHPPRVQRQPTPPVPQPTQPNRMIVHLNLFPKKSQKNGARRTTPVPTLITFVPGGGSHFQDRMFDSPDVTTEGKSVVAPYPPVKGSHLNITVPDESMEIAEIYPDVAVDGSETFGPSATFLDGDQMMEPSSPYDFVIGGVHHSDAEPADEADDDGGEVYVDDTEEESQDYGEEDHEGRRGKSTFHEEENEGLKNGYKVVSFQITSGDGEVINDGGILRAQVNTDAEDEMKRVIDGSGGTVLTGMSGDYEQPPALGDGVENDSDKSRKQHLDRVNRVKGGIRIKQIAPKGVGGPMESNRPNSSDNDGVPIGTVSDNGASELDFVPGYNEGAGIEPRIDLRTSWWPKGEMLIMNDSASSTPSILSPTPTTTTGETTEKTSAEDVTTSGDI